MQFLASFCSSLTGLTILYVSVFRGPVLLDFATGAALPNVAATPAAVGGFVNNNGKRLLNPSSQSLADENCLPKRQCQYPSGSTVCIGAPCVCSRVLVAHISLSLLLLLCVVPYVYFCKNS